MLKTKTFIIILLCFFVGQSFSQNTKYSYAIFRYEDPDSMVMRIIAISGYDYAAVNRPNCSMYIKDSIFVNKLIDRFNKLTIDSSDTTYTYIDVTYQLICIKTGYGYDVLNVSGYGSSRYPKMELNGKPMIVDKKLLKLLDRIVKIHKERNKPQFFPKDRINELYRDEFW